VSDDELLSELDLGGPKRTPRADTLERTHPSPRPLDHPHVAHSRDLTEADMTALALPRQGQPPKSLMRLHASHHSLARCLATGMKPMQASLVTGYSPGRISALQRDPAFTALVEDYRREAKSVFADLAERMNEITLDAIEMLHERMQDAPEALTIPMLMDIIRSFADRTGHGPGQEVHLKMSPDLIDRPPRETAEEWAARRARELAPEPPKLITKDQLN
jgi:hypothetical protein